MNAMSEGIFRRILVADDGSTDGERAASIAVDLGAKLGAEVILLGVVEPANVQAEGEGLPIEDPSSSRRMMEERFERFLVQGRSLGVTMIVEIVEGHPAEQIRRRAEADGVDLIVVGRRSLSGVRRWFEGSTSESVLRESTCSVLIAR
jgi:nucleotide-binding universal stress UspA family protein